MGLALDITYALGLTLTSPIWAFNLLRTGKYRTDWAGRFGKGASLGKNTQGKTILFHAVSVGEVNLIRKLVDELQLRDPTLRLIIASTTNTGIDTANKSFGEKHTVIRYPLDFSCAVKRLLDRTQPDLVATVELEVWPHLTSICKQRGIPVAVINGRISDRSFPRYEKLKPIFSHAFSRLSAAAMQTKTYADRIAALGVARDKVQVLDTMKWDTADLSGHVEGTAELAEQMGIDRSKPIIVLGSTGDTEEVALVNALKQAVSNDVQIIAVPRKPERFDEVAAALPGIVRRSEHKGGGRALDDQQLFLLDTLGELRKAYQLADIVIVGRSFNGWGASDPIEPIALGKPTIIGPAVRNFREVIDAFIEGEGIRQVDAPQQAATEAARLLADRDSGSKLAAAGREVVRARLGSTKRHADFLLNLLETRG